MIKRLLLIASISCLISIYIGCAESEPASAPALPPEPAPTITPVPAQTLESTIKSTSVAVEQFNEGTDGWIGFADEGALSEVSWDAEGKLIWSTQTGVAQAAALIHNWPDLSKADGLTIRLTSLNRSAFLILGVQEDDGSIYSLILPLDKDGVDYDYMGLSYYPSAFGMVAASRLYETMDKLSLEIGKPIVIAETAYPAELPSGGMFGDWRRALPGYPLTPTGQAWWLSDMLKRMRDRGDVLGVYVFSPDFWFSGELWGPFALFDSEGNARPAVASFRLDD